MKCNWKVSQHENGGCSFWVYEVLYVFFMLPSDLFSLQQMSGSFFFFFKHNLCFKCLFQAVLESFAYYEI